MQEAADLSKTLTFEATNGTPVLWSFRFAEVKTGIKVRTWHRWASKGLVRVVRPAGGHPRIPRAEVQRILREAAEQ